MPDRPLVYVAGPLSTGDTTANLVEAIRAANRLFDLGYAPYVPHLNHFWGLLHPREYEDWMELNFEFLLLVDVVYRLPGASPGADRETQRASELGIPVYRDLDRLVAEIPL